MNWKSIKSFLILLVVLVDVLLLRFCYTYYTSRDYTAHSTAEDAAAILGESGITVSPDLLAVRADSVPARSCTYTREDYARLVLSLLSAADTDGIFLLPDGIRAVTTAGDVARGRGEKPTGNDRRRLCVLHRPRRSRRHSARL